MANFNSEEITSEIEQKAEDCSRKKVIKYDLKFLKAGIDKAVSHKTIDPLNALQQLRVDDDLNVLNQFLESHFQEEPRTSMNCCEAVTPTTTFPVIKVDAKKVRELLQKTGYPLDITPGLRRYGGPPPNWEGSSPSKGCEVFCGNIPKDMFEYELVPIFEKCGTIWELRLMMDPLNGTNRGFAFVKFTTREEAGKTVRQLNNFEIKPHKHLMVNISHPNLTLYVGNIPKCKDKDDILNEFGKLTSGLVDAIIYCTRNDPEINRGFCFLEYESQQAATVAKRKLIYCKKNIWGGDIIVNWAKPVDEFDEQRRNQVKILFVRNLTRQITEDKLKQEFEQFGKVVRVKKIRNYAFVYFENRDCAHTAMRQLNGKELESSKMEISLAKPTADKYKKDEILHAREHRLIQGHPISAANPSLHSHPNMMSLRIPMSMPGGLRVQHCAPVAPCNLVNNEHQLFEYVVPNRLGPITGGGWLRRFATPYNSVFGLRNNVYQLGAPQLPSAFSAVVLNQLLLNQLRIIAQGGQPETEALREIEQTHSLSRCAQLAQLLQNLPAFSRNAL